MAKKDKKVSIFIGGYGNLYVNQLLEDNKKSNYQITGVVDPESEGCEKLNLYILVISAR